MNVQLLGILTPLAAVVIWALISNHFSIKQLKRDRIEDKKQIDNLFALHEVNNAKFTEISISLAEIKVMLKIITDKEKGGKS